MVAHAEQPVTLLSPAVAGGESACYESARIHGTAAGEKLAQDGAELAFEGLQQLGHHPLNGFVGQRLFRILEGKAQGVLFLVGKDLRTAIDVEEFHTLEQVALGLQRAGAQVGEADAFIQQQRQVAAPSRRSWRNRW